jgi:endonuclease/exonuclease/phosphatase family metal-dependent hydrolase
MKLISLNTWGGRAGKKNLLNFFDKYRDVDIFCLQEIWAAPYEDLEYDSVSGFSIDDDYAKFYVQEIVDWLTTHTAYFRPQYFDYWGLMILIKKDIDVISEGELFVHKEKDYIPEDIGLFARNIQFTTIATPNGNRSIINFHGLWNGKGKGDSEDRLLQSDRIIDFVKTLANPYIIAGDFNLLPDTQSIKKFEDLGLNNLIKEYNITSTRTSFYTKPEKFADYVFTSKDIIIKDFKVLPDEVSDHSALYLEFE